MHINAAAISHEPINLHFQHDVPFLLIHSTTERIKGSAIQAVKHSREYHAQHQRSALACCPSLDHHVFDAAIKHMKEDEHVRIVRHIASLGSVSQHSMRNTINMKRKSLVTFVGLLSPPLRTSYGNVLMPP